MSGVITTIKDRCKQCYACVRNCPVKAVKITRGQAAIMEERCIGCGNCEKVCAQEAKLVLSGLAGVKNLLQAPDKVIACLAPSFVAVFPAIPWQQVVSGIKRLGFSEVWAVAAGAELVVREYAKLMLNLPSQPVISSNCPALVGVVTKHYPELLPQLAPIVSPMLATARIVKAEYGDSVKVVFIGPCIAKKAEAREAANHGLVDEVLTFRELQSLFQQYEIEPEKLPPAGFDGVQPRQGRLFPLAGALAELLHMPRDVCSGNAIVTAEGAASCLETLKSIATGQCRPRLVDALFCRGCIDGPELTGDLTLLERRQAVVNHFTEGAVTEGGRQNAELVKFFFLDLKRDFDNQKIPLPVPSEEEIRQILKETGKLSPEDELNCGACGYTSCREKAIAVFQGIAENEMCLPYVFTQKNRLLEQMAGELETVCQLNKELDGIIESSYDGICVADGQGVTLRVNAAYKRLVGLQDRDVLGVHSKELEREKIIFPSATLLVLREKRPVTVMQETKSGKKVLATGTPIFNEQGIIVRIVTNIRDLTELSSLRLQIEEAERLKTHYQSSSTAVPAPRNIVAYSIEMGKVLQTASKVAAVDSTVLILGESGVGKEVVARFVHQSSLRQSGPFIQINCGAIPETLIESELFGYETGAFTGARREGKPGLIELANNGTLFLDEIGELPPNLQVKLLQVIQERQILRIGGTKPNRINARFIAATNRNLQRMVRDGTFRADLFYRLNVVPLAIPPLRERKDDIIPLINHFLAAFNARYGCNKQIAYDTKDFLTEYHWPGNVRELENIIERLIVTVDEATILPAHLPDAMKNNVRESRCKIFVTGLLPLKQAIEEVESQLITLGWQQCANTYKLAKILEVNQSTVVRKIQKYLKFTAHVHE
ncbi:pas fold-4 [Lucifera butyrica]|uniref:Pas fold-4 n=1 Tax=Lucifera butyrica TaxID=1351585 RepID=A0A498RFG8_9FIRM|nr:sigma 54-interacting transcriptional regulator [Lucifera butyrica]VBB09697.1 pas fold-4 [Lucifera butyrica]